ncbi:MAG: SpoIIE family protein phosphatase [Crocinitomicaceae bacterium]|nr:SpoIIE family protein phosphatase [Crocinitomicaceae bacterium]
MLKRTPFEKKVIGLLIIVVLSVACIAMLVNVNLRNIITDITEEAKQDESLILMKEMVYDIADAENGVKSYSLTKNPIYLNQFELKTASVETKIQRLRDLSEGDETRLANVDSLEKLTKNKFLILEDLLILQDQYRVDKVLDQVLKNINEVTATNNEDVNSSNSEQAKDNSNTDQEIEESEGEKGFFQRLFNRRKNKEDENSGKQENETELEGNTNNTTEDILTTKDKDEINFNKEVNRIRDSELENEKEIKAEELRLIQQDKAIMDQIMGIISQMEKEHSANLEKQLELSKEESEVTKYLVAGFSLLVIIMLIFAAYTLYKYVKRNNAYKKALKQAKNETEQRNREVMDSIQYAQRIQSAILPDMKKVTDCLPESFILYKPKDIVAGDFYWMVELPDKNKTLFAVADCTGHGVPGAMVSVVCSNALNRSVREFGLYEPARILEKTRDLVIETLDEGGLNVNDGMDIALCAIDHSNGKLQYAGANNSLYILKKEKMMEVKPDKQPVGKHIWSKPFTNHELEFEKGDQIYLFTDGLPDQFGGPKGKKFKYEPFKELLIQSSVNSTEVQKQQINSAFENWRGSFEQIDDVCVVGVRL